MSEFDNKHLPKESFEFVQKEEKIFDKKFETKPIGYFKDAMIRFSKNKTNVIASSILFIIILGTIIFPIISSKNTEELEPELANLPPRMPWIENFHPFGWHIFDGTDEKTDQPVDASTMHVDEITGETVGYPIGFNPEFIVPGTLVNYTIECTESDVLCVGGENLLRVKNLFDHVSIISPEAVYLYPANNPTFTINVNEFEGADAELNIYAQTSPSSDYFLLDTITGPGEYTIDPTTILDPDPEFYGTRFKIEFASTNTDDFVVFDFIEITTGDDEDTIYSYEGYELSLFEYDSEDENSSGLYVRQHGGIIFSTFRYDEYGAALSDKAVLAFPASKFDIVMEEFGTACTSSDDPDNPDPEGLIFADTCPIKKVIARTSSVVVDEVEYFSYSVIMNYAEYKGYEETPYFLFGTDDAGRDLFTLLWIATRTSLLLGVIVASINISIGIVYGSISGYYGGKVDIIMQRFSEVVGRIPWLVTLSIMIALFGPGIQTLILILIVSGWIGIAGITRTQFYRYKGREYVLASRTLGARDARLIFRHILPNGIGTIITSSILTIPYVIFAESTISYLGFGIGHGQNFNFFGLEFSGVSVGVLLADGRSQLLQRPYLTLFPAILISILMITFNMFGNALRDAFNPALRGSE